MSRESSSSQIFCLLAKLLDYPSEESSKLLEELIKKVPRHDLLGIRELFRDLFTAQELYTRTFDFSEKTTLYLTFYYSGYTRDRGLELLRLKEILEKHGVTPEKRRQLPDYLPLLLELVCRDYSNIMILARYRQAIEIIGKRLREEKNPYSALFEVLLELIPKTQSELRVEEKLRIEVGGLGESYEFSLN